MEELHPPYRAPQDTGRGHVDRGDVVPLYHQIKELIKRRVTDRVWRQGEAIPSENELAGAYDVSVGTVKKALAELVHEGILIRRQGKGTFVARPDFQRSFMRFFRYGLSRDEERIVPGSKVLASRILVPPQPVRAALRLAPRDRAIAITRVRTVREVPLVVEDLYLPQKTFRGFERRDISRALLYPIYDSEYGTPVLWAEEWLQPGVASKRAAQALGLAVGDPVMHVERIAYTFGDRPIEYRKSVGRGDRYRYHIEIR